MSTIIRCCRNADEHGLAVMAWLLVNDGLLGLRIGAYGAYRLCIDCICGQLCAIRCVTLVACNCVCHVLMRETMMSHDFRS